MVTIVILVAIYEYVYPWKQDSLNGSILRKIESLAVTRKLFIADLDIQVTEHNLQEFFTQTGAITSMQIRRAKSVWSGVLMAKKKVFEHPYKNKKLHSFKSDNII